VDQHFVTRFYLKGFCDPIPSPRHGESLWECDLVDGTIRRRSPKRVATERDYYSFVDAAGVANHSIEEMLAALESRGAPVVAKLRAGNLVVTPDERGQFILFVAFLIVRVPSFRNYLEEATGKLGESLLRVSAQHPEYFTRTMRKAMAAAGEEITDAKIEETRQLALDPGKHFKISGTRESSLAHALKVAMKIVQPLLRMDWELLAAPGGEHFISGDTPVTWRNPHVPEHLGGLGMPGTELSLPLGPAVCLVAKRKAQTAVTQVGDDCVRDLNRERVRHADRFVYADSEGAAREAMQTYATLRAEGIAHAPPFRFILLEDGRWPTAVRSQRLP
jgi:hypothetical protein